jgi:peptidoglycan/xylan/chitin deacetylase (PgdA/CDA1 family)
MRKCYESLVASFRGAAGVKPIMYHYVRPNAAALPYFPYLSVADFERQLEHFERTYGFVTRDAFARWVEGGPAPNGVLLTFDDGLRDHSEFVLPSLRARGIFGLFYVPSGPSTTGRILDVHKVHLVLGKIGGKAIVDWLDAEAPHLLSFSQDAVDPYYVAQTADKATKFVKYLFNWRMEEEAKRAVLDELLNQAFDGNPPTWQDIYLDEEALHGLSEAGMGVGPHGHSHQVTSLLSPELQREEIDLSCAFVERVGGSRLWGYCHPFGTLSSFSPDTEETVAQAGCPFAFAVASQDITTPLADERRYSLPRHNCNSFPNGAVSYG